MKWFIFAIIAAFMLHGCADKVPMMKLCHVPYTPLPVINNTPCPEKDYKCIHDKDLLNYEAQKTYGETLRSNSEVCQ